MVIAGVEFCPQLFQKRDFFYYRIPGTKIRVGSTTLSTAASPSGTPVLTHLVASSPVEWQVAKASQGGNAVEYGPGILLGYLSSMNANGANAWDDWSFKNPAHAKILWPIVQEAAEQNLYFCVPELLQHAHSQKNLGALNRTLRLVCVEAAQTKLLALVDKQNLSARSELQSWALAIVNEFKDDAEFESQKPDFAKE